MNFKSFSGHEPAVCLCCGVTGDYKKSSGRGVGLCDIGANPLTNLTLGGIYGMFFLY